MQAVLNATRDIGLKDCPNEVLQSILGNLDLMSFRNARLSCHDLAAAGRYLLYENLYVTETPESFKRMLEISTSDDEAIANSNRTFNYIAFTVINHTKEKWEQQTKRGSPEGVLLDEQYDCSAPYSKYKSFKDQRSLLFGFKSECEPAPEPARIYVVPSGSIFDHLSRALCNLLIPRSEPRPESAGSYIDQLSRALHNLKPKTVNIILGNGRDVSFRENLMPGECHKMFSDITHSLLHAIFPPTPIRPSHYHFIATRSFIAILLAIEKSGIRIENFSAETGLLFLLSPFMPQFCQAISSLKRLNLVVEARNEDKNFDRLRPDYPWDGKDRGDARLISTRDDSFKMLANQSLGEFLNNAQDLRELELCAPDIAYTQRPRKRYNAIIRDKLALFGLETCYWPLLESLTLKSLSCDSETLFDLIIKHGKTLRKLKLEDIYFSVSQGNEKRVGNQKRVKVEWTFLFLRLQAAVQRGDLKLESLELSGLFVNWYRIRGPCITLAFRSDIPPDFSCRSKFWDENMERMSIEWEQIGKEISEWVLEPGEHEFPSLGKTKDATTGE